jgi:parallel beta-helix repeat protein
VQTPLKYWEMTMRATELSTLIGDPGDLITVQAHSVPGDGGGGTFMWSTIPYPTALPAEDGGIVFGTTPTGRWIRQWSGYINVRWFGARGDGTGFDPILGDTNRIQKAIDFCAAYRSGGEIVGGTVFFPPGIYVVAAPFNNAAFKLILRSRVRLLGCGSSSELRSALNQNFNARTLSEDNPSPDAPPLADVTIQSLRIEGRETEQPHDGTNVQRAAIFVFKTKNLKVIDCIFHDTADAIRLAVECIGTYIAGNEIFGNPIDIGRECLLIHAARESIIENNYIHDCPFATAIKMVEGAPPSIDFSNIVRGNVCMDVGTGVTLKGGCIATDNILKSTLLPAATLGHRCHFIGNRIIEGIQVGILVQSSDDTAENVIIANNTITNIHLADGTACDGIRVVRHTSFIPQNITISSNVIENLPAATNAFNGVLVEQGGDNIAVDNNQIYGAHCGICLGPGSNNTIERFRATNNTITLKANGTGIGLGADSSVNGNLRHVVVSGNIVTKAEPAVTGTVGIKIDGDPDGVILTSNDTSDTATPFLSVGAPPTNLVTANNIGF